MRQALLRKKHAVPRFLLAASPNEAREGITEFRSEFRSDFQHFKDGIDTQFQNIDGRFERIETTLNHLNTKFALLASMVTLLGALVLSKII